MRLASRLQILEGKQHLLFVPTIEMLGLAEVRVAEQTNAAKARHGAQGAGWFSGLRGFVKIAHDVKDRV